MRLQFIDHLYFKMSLVFRNGSPGYLKDFLRSSLDVCHLICCSQSRWSVRLPVRHLSYDALCGIKIWWYLSEFIIRSILTRSLTQLPEVQPQTITESVLCFTDGWWLLLLYLSSDVLHTLNDDLNKRKIGFICSVQFLCNFSFFYFLKYGFLTATVPPRPFMMRLQ